MVFLRGRLGPVGERASGFAGNGSLAEDILAAMFASAAGVLAATFAFAVAVLAATFAVAPPAATFEAASPAARGSPAKFSVLTSLPERLPPCFWNSSRETGGSVVAA